MARITKAALEAQVAELQAQLVALTAERDALRASDAKASELVEYLSRPAPSTPLSRAAAMHAARAEAMRTGRTTRVAFH